MNSCDFQESPNIVHDPLWISFLPFTGEDTEACQLGDSPGATWCLGYHPSLDLQPEVGRGAGSPTSGPLDDPSHTVWGSPREKTALKFPTGRLRSRRELYSGHRGVTLSTLLTSLYLRLPIWKKTGSAAAGVSWIPSACWRLYCMALHRTYLVP